MSYRRKIFVICVVVLSLFVACERSRDTVFSGDADNSVDDSWDSSGGSQIVLNTDSIIATGEGATVDGCTVTVVSAGTYVISGSLDDGQIIVDTEDRDDVRLILNGVDIASSTGPPVHVINGGNTIIVLTDNTINTVTDSESYIAGDLGTDEPNAALFSMSDLVIEGGGSLTVEGNYEDGISCKDGLKITGGTISVVSVDDGIRGKDSIVVGGADITVSAQGNGLLSDNESDPAKGYISVGSGTLTVTSGGDAISAASDIAIDDGIFVLTSGGGSSQTRYAADPSTKGIKAANSLRINGGTFTVDSADDAFHSNGTLTINGGSIDISTGNDGIFAESTVEINGGDILIEKSFEGIESREVIIINDGNIHIVSSDDGLNGAGGDEGAGMGVGRPPGPRGFAPSGGYYLYLNGGYCVIDAKGDGIDINGTVVMTGGDIIVNGPTSSIDGALDYDISYKISGGSIIAVGSSRMAQAPDASSTLCSVLVNLRAVQEAGTIIHIQTGMGEEILTFKPAKRFQSIVFSSSKLVKGSVYDLYLGGSSTGTIRDGLYRDGTYTPGEKYTGFTVTGTVTRVFK